MVIFNSYVSLPEGKEISWRFLQKEWKSEKKHMVSYGFNIEIVEIWMVWGYLHFKKPSL